MKTVIHADVELSTLILGPEDGSPIVLLHGLVSGNMATWYSTVALPLAKTHRVALYDLRGHGDSSLPQQGFDLDSHVGDLLAVIGARLPNARQVDLVGHSLGALIALRFALTYPERVRRLVLIDAPMPAKHWVGPSLSGVKSSAALAEWVNEQPYLMNDSRGRRRERLHRRLESLLLSSTLVADVMTMESESDVALRMLQLPVLLIYGQHSPCLEVGYQLQKILPNAELTLLDCGHYIPVEMPGALRQILEQYFAPAHSQIMELE